MSLTCTFHVAWFSVSIPESSKDLKFGPQKRTIKNGPFWAEIWHPNGRSRLVLLLKVVFMFFTFIAPSNRDRAQATSMTAWCVMMQKMDLSPICCRTMKRALIYRVLKGGWCPRGRGSWGTMRIPKKKIGEPWGTWGRLGESPPPLKNPIIDWFRWWVLKRWHSRRKNWMERMKLRSKDWGDFFWVVKREKGALWNWSPFVFCVWVLYLASFGMVRTISWVVPPPRMQSWQMKV